MDGILISAFAPMSAIIVAIITSYVTLKIKHKEVKEENKTMRIELECINILFNHEFLAVLNEHVNNIFEQTKVNRFLILFAVNGKTSFRYVTCCFEKVGSGAVQGSIFRYNRFEIDDHYKNMLKQVELQGSVQYEVKTMPNSMLKSIYESRDEKVTYSCIKFLKRINVNEDNDIVLYSSLATTNSEDYTNEESIVIKRNFDLIKSEARKLTYG